MFVLSDRARKLLYLTLFLAVLIGGVVAYFVITRSAPSTPSGPTQDATNPGTLPNAGQATPGSGAVPVGSLPSTNPLRLPDPTAPSIIDSLPRTSVLVDGATQFASLGPARSTGDLRFYNSADGKFYRVNDLGETTPLSDKAFYGVETVNWGSATDAAILEFPDGSNVYYDFEAQRQITLPKHWADFTFSPDDQQIVAKSLGNNESNRFLILSNPDGSNAQAIQELGDNAAKVHTAWSPSGDIVAYAHTGNDVGFNREQIILVGKNRENLPGLITEGRGFTPSWSPNGTSLVYSVYTSENGYLPELWVSGGTAENINSNRRRLELNTWGDKCAWHTEELLYCAVPSRLEVGAALQRDALPQGADQLFRINLRTGQKTNLGAIEGANAVSDLTIARDGTYATMRNVTTGQILRTRLSP